MFLIRLPPSMTEAVGTGNQKTAAAIVKAADALWDAQGGHNPTVAATMTQQSRSPAPTGEKKCDKRNVNVCSKICPPSHPDFYSLHNPGNSMCKFHNYYANKAHRCISPRTWFENCITTEPFPFQRPFQHTPLPWPCIFRLMLD
jgi:hypothetical protein